MCCVCGGGSTGGRLSLAAKYLEGDSIAGKYLPQSFRNKTVVFLSVALFMVILVSCLIIKVRRSRKGLDDYQVA